MTQEDLTGHALTPILAAWLTTLTVPGRGYDNRNRIWSMSAGNRSQFVGAADPGRSAGSIDDTSEVTAALWFNPDASGEGWVLGVLPYGQALGYWFTYDEGRQSALGSIEAGSDRRPMKFSSMIWWPRLAVALVRDFDPDEVDRVRVGSARLVPGPIATAAGLGIRCLNGQSQTIDLVRP